MFQKECSEVKVGMRCARICETVVLKALQNREAKGGHPFQDHQNRIDLPSRT
jgi:hypothetical protein